MKKYLFAIGWSILLSACAPSVKPIQTIQPSPKVKQKTLIQSEPEQKSGNYYLDDGPPLSSEEEAYRLANAKDAIPRFEKVTQRYNRPYTVFGKEYIPFTSLLPYRQRGVSSWYGRRYHGRLTASGEVYDMFEMTAAHPTLPIPSYAKVTHLKNGKSVVVRINDRGPFLENRLIDLSYAAASRLQIVESGTGEVVVETILPTENKKPAIEIESQVYIQLGAFSSSVAASQLEKSLKNILSEDFQVEIRVTNKGLHAVQIGPYQNRKEALIAEDTLCQHHYHCGFIIER